MAATDFFTFITALRGFHVYHNNVNWNSYIGQDLSFKCELHNMHDKFAVCGKALLPGKIAPVVVGHAAKELSGHIWFAVQKGVKISAVVDNTKPKPSPLLQGGLEILIKMTVYWSNKNYMQMLKEKVSKIKRTSVKSISLKRTSLLSVVKNPIHLKIILRAIRKRTNVKISI